MFRNVGKLLHALENLLFWLISLTSLILAFVFGIEEHYGFYSRYYDFNAGIFFLFFAGVPIVAYIMSLLMHGFGTIVSHFEKEIGKENNVSAKEEPATTEEENDPATETDVLPYLQEEYDPVTEADALPDQQNE